MFVDGRIFSLQRQGGISRLYYEILHLMTHERSCELFRGFYQDEYDWCTVPLVRNTGLRWSPPPRNKLLSRVKQLADAVWLELAWAKSRRKGNDVYVSTYYRLPRNRADAFIVVGDYDCAHERFPELFPGGERIIQMKRRAFAAADLILTISESSRQDVMRFYGVPRHKIEGVHLGVDRFFDRSKAEEAVENSKRKPYLLYVGSRALYKNFSVLESAFQTGLVKDYEVVVVGGGPLNESEMNAFHGRVRWLDAGDGELRTLYQEAAAFIYPSLHEGFGLPPLEALACGCPVVVADIQVAHEVLGEHAEYFKPDEPAALVDAISRAVDQDRDTRMRGYAHARSYTWEKAASAFVEKINTHRSQMS